MKYRLFILVLAVCIIGDTFTGRAADTAKSSRIIQVKLYQNQAKITRQAALQLKKGLNNVVFHDLPPLLYDWSVRGSLPKNFKGKIISLEVEKKALITKRQKRILRIEAKLKNLREKDRVFVDDLNNIQSQEKFLNSILNFTNQTVSKELATRIPQVKVWDNTLNYVSRKKKALLHRKREIENWREEIGKKIQKWEFELSQIAGASYFNNYQTLNKSVLKNRAANQIQQFADITGKYAERKRMLWNPREKVAIEKRLLIIIKSPEEKKVNFFFSYVIPDTRWKMKYDIRADSRHESVAMIVYGDIYQKTGENWKNVAMALSTGTPINAISPPVLQPWYLDVSRVYDSDDEKEYDKRKLYEKKSEEISKDKGKGLYDAVIKEKGPFVEIILPVRQTILSSTKYQKKFIKDFSITGRNLTFFYEVIPAKVKKGYLKALTENTTGLPWLSGEAQIFLDNEFMGKVSIPYTPPGKKEEIVLGIETRIISQKELVRKYEDTKGLLGGKRRILYQYKISVENQMPDKREIIVYDRFPVSRNKKIDVEVKNISVPLFVDEEFKKTTSYARGIRKWKLPVKSREKKEITYDIIVTFDKDITISGIR